MLFYLTCLSVYPTNLKFVYVANYQSTDMALWRGDPGCWEAAYSGERQTLVSVVDACAHVCKHDTVPVPFLLSGWDLLASPEQVRESGLMELIPLLTTGLISELVKLLFEHRNEVLLPSESLIGLFQVVLVVKDQPANAGGIG